MSTIVASKPELTQSVVEVTIPLSGMAPRTSDTSRGGTAEKYQSAIDAESS
ncbi:MAG: hypothetical protein IPL73_06025 [Candidatus Obscuribacter sp.]|nr:hypothetical protein [Candidatus Obscuribacter sp.]